MKKILYYDFTKCNLQELEELYFCFCEERRKELLGSAICNWYIKWHEKGAIKDEQFELVMSAFFPPVDHVKYISPEVVYLKKPSFFDGLKSSLNKGIKSIFNSKGGAAV